MMCQGNYVNHFKINNIYRFLGNHYNPEIHTRSFWPNGLYTLKKNYQYNNDVGLYHIYERNNVLDRLDTEAKNKKPVLSTKFVEYEYLEENEAVITIEHW